MDDPTPSPSRASATQAGAGGLLGVWHGVEPGSEEAFDDWYDRQHHRERVGVPGFLRARRYLNAARGPRYFNRYDVTDAEVLVSPAYLDRVDRAVALHLLPLIPEGALADRLRLVYDLHGRPEPRRRQREDEEPCGS